MTVKEQHQAIIEQADFAESNVSDLEVLTQGAGADNTFVLDFTNIYQSFDKIRDWSNQKIMEADQAEVMTNFLSELKVVFDKYTAKIEVGVPDGYGIDWGNALPDTGVRFTATLNGVTAAKEINKTVIVSGDLV